MVLITLLGHCLIYLLIPTIYTNQKEKQAIEISNEIVRKLQESESKTPQELVEQYAKKSKSCISLSYEGEQYVFGRLPILHAGRKNMASIPILFLLPVSAPFWQRTSIVLSMPTEYLPAGRNPVYIVSMISSLWMNTTTGRSRPDPLPATSSTSLHRTAMTSKL